MSWPLAMKLPPVLAAAPEAKSAEASTVIVATQRALLSDTRIILFPWSTTFLADDGFQGNVNHSRTQARPLVKDLREDRRARGTTQGRYGWTALLLMKAAP